QRFPVVQAAVNGHVADILKHVSRQFLEQVMAAQGGKRGGVGQHKVTSVNCMVKATGARANPSKALPPKGQTCRAVVGKTRQPATAGEKRSIAADAVSRVAIGVPVTLDEGQDGRS